MDAVLLLIEAYRHLAEKVSPEVSRTARLIQAQKYDLAHQRLRQEIDECLMALAGDHLHNEEKRALPRTILRGEKLPEELADIVIELQQVAYWCLVGWLASKNTLTGTEVAQSLRKGAACRISAAELGSAAGRDADPDSVFRFVGRASVSAGLPLDLFARLDLADMRSRPYLKDVIKIQNLYKELNHGNDTAGSLSDLQ
jgi:hypothetical protein